MTSGEVKDHDDRDGAQRLGKTRQIHFVRLLQAAFVHVRQSVDHLIEIDAHADGEHPTVVAAHETVGNAYDHHDDAGDDTIDLVIGKSISLGKIGHLKRSHAVIAHEHEDEARDEGHGEHACLLCAHKLCDNDRE
ncbi:MAG: hypothetical protein ACLTQI_08400 [Slackia sp.]